MLEEKEFKEEEITYRIQELLASERFKLGIELGKLTGGAFNGFGIDTDINLGAIISGFFNNSSSYEFSEFMKKTLRNSVVQPNFEDEKKYEIHFGKYFHHIPTVFTEILEQNFGKVIQELKKKLTKSELFTTILKIILEPEKEKKDQEENSNQ